MSTKPQDARHIPLSDVDRLRQDAAHAAQVRALTTHPDVVALRTERFRSQVDALMWAGLLLGLAFTMVNVQQFAAAGAAVWSLAWLAAWLLDPMVSLVLVAVLRAEQITARYQVRTGPWVHRTKWFAFLATYAMNTWHSWAELNAAGILAHSVPPFAVICVAETGPHLRDRLTEAVLRAARPTNDTVSSSAGDTSQDITVGATSTQDTDMSALGARTGERRTRRSRTSAAPKPRTSRWEYLSQARDAHRPGMVVTPEWVREAIPEISRGTSKVVADLLKAELVNHTTTVTAPATSDSAEGLEQGRAA